MKLKATLAAIVGGVMLMGATAASAATELKVWCWDDNFNVPAVKMAAERYTAKHPDVTVKVESIAQDNLVQKLNASLGAKNLATLPDIVLIEDYRVQNFLIGYPDFLKSIDGKIDLSGFIDNKVMASSGADGKHYGVPFDSGVVSTFIRKDLAEKAGYTVADFQDITWDQFIEMGKKIKEATGTNLIAYDPNDMQLLHAMMQSAGWWYTNADGTKVTLANNEALKEGLEIIRKLHEADVVINYSGWNQLMSTITEQQVATVVQGCWLTPSVEAVTDQSGKWVIVPFPKLSKTANATHYTNLGGSQWYVNNYSKNADEAINFLKETFASDVDLINELSTKIALVTTIKDTSKITSYQQANEFFCGQKIYEDFAKWNPKIPPVSYGPHTRAIESLVAEALQRVLAGEDVAAVLEDTQGIAEMQVGL